MTTHPEPIIKLEKSHIKRASLMLARAFHDDPIIDYAFPQRKSDDSRPYYAYEFMVRLGMRTGYGYTTSPKVEGVAIWARIKTPRTSFGDMLFSGGLLSAIRMGWKAGMRMQKFASYLEKKHTEVINDTHWYLQLLGVDPDHQGMGHASRLLRYKLSQIDKEGLACYLETELEDNVPLYEHFGFQTVERYQVPETPLVMWLMLRPPVR